MELLEDRTLMSADPLSGQFQLGSGVLTLHGTANHAVVTASLTSAGYLQLNVGGQLFSSNPAAGNYDPGLAGATRQTLRALELNGDPAADHLSLGNLTVAGGLSVQSDDILEIQGSVSAAGPVQLSGKTVLLSGQVEADGPVGGTITVSATNVLQSGSLQADGSQGPGGSVTVAFTGQYLATVSSLTAANSTGAGAGGLVVIDGGATGTLFTSGKVQATADQGSQGGEIELFGSTVQLVGAGVNASGRTGGGWIRVGGDSPSDIAAHGGSSAGITFAATTTVAATTTLTADALGAGNGGHIVVWSQDTTTFGGTLHAQGAGAAGQGGLLEVSSAGTLTYGGHASAASTSGHAGQLLLDPQNLIISSSVGLPEFNLANPKPDLLDTFGASIVPLNNGNIVVTDPTSGLVALNAGAVFLYDGSSGALLGTLTGDVSNDQVGSGGVTALTNGNYVVSSPVWQSAGAAVGAATWCSGEGGATAGVSALNSLVGSTDGDEVSIGDQAANTTGITALSNGNYVVDSPFWQDSNGDVVGAVTWGNGLGGTVGPVSASNSLVGSTAGDDVGSQGVTALAFNGNYVVSSPNWQIDDDSVGAATWGNGDGGTVGPISSSNSLVGEVTQGGIATLGVTALTNGDYVVDSPGWQDSTGNTLGAVTWGDGFNGTAGEVGSANSLIGATNFDLVGQGGVTALPDGNYVVSSSEWQDNNGVVGAVTWESGTGPVSDVVSSTNSIIGQTGGDDVGSGGVTALTNNNYVISSPNWQSGGVTVGAVTWAASDGSTIETVSAGNSIVGSTAGDYVGYGTGNPGSGVVALGDGNYVVDSPFWQSNGATVGAVTWANGYVSTSEAVATTNSLTGSTDGDSVGSSGVTPLNFGEYVVVSPSWQNNGATVGAVTWAENGGGTTGPVTTANSLVGSTDGDYVGSGGITVLSDGDYLVSSPDWQDNGVQVGAATVNLGTNGKTLDGVGTVDANNSLLGTGSNYLLQQVVGIPGSSSFLVSITGNGGTVLEVPTVTASQAFSFLPGQTLSLSPSFLETTLDTGTAVVLQANNDITVSSPIVEDNPAGTGGALTLQAGRDIILNASITTDNGNLTLIANDTAADGVIAADRETGTASITMAAGTSITAGTGTVSVTLASGDGAGSGIQLGAISTSGGLTVQSSGTITQVAPLDITAAASLTAAGPITLSNIGNTFTGTLTIGAAATSVTLDAAGNLALATTTFPTNLTVDITGSLTEASALTLGNASFIAGSINLSNAGNVFLGTLTLSAATSLHVVNSTALTVANLSLTSSATFSAPSLTFTGTLVVGSQTLTLTSTSPAVLDGVTTLAHGTINAADGIVLGGGSTLSGTGSLSVGTGADGVFVKTGATVTPDLLPGGLNFHGDLTFSSNAILDEQIQSATVFSQFSVNGTLTLGNALLAVTFLDSYVPPPQTSFEIIANVAGLAVNGTFSQGSSFTASGTSLTVNYASGANNVALAVPLPAAPVADNDSASLLENSAATPINVLANDTGTGLHITAVTQGTDGTVVITGGGTGLTYQPNNLFTGFDTFTYTVTDGYGRTATATVTVQVTPVDQPPVITVPGAQQFVANQGLVITGISVADPDVYEGTGMVQTTLSVLNGVLTLGSTYGLTFTQGNGTANSTMEFTGLLAYVNEALASLTYTSDVDTAQPDTLTINVNDLGNFGAGGPKSDQATVALTPKTSVTVLADPVLTGKKDVVIQGSINGDTISVAVGKTAGSYTVTVNGVVQTVTGVTGEVLIFEQNGASTITVSSTVKLPALITVGNGNNTVTGGGGANTITAGNGNNHLTGGAGNDTFTVGTGSNVINGAAGTNTLIESGAVNLTLVGGTTKVNGSLTKGAATDTLTLATIQKVELTLTGPGNLEINATAFSGAETLFGGSGNDTLLAGNGNDVLVGGSGNSMLKAGSGFDVLIAGGGADTLIGGTNQDLLIGGSTTYDANVAALASILAEWDSASSYTTKIKQLMGTQAGGLNGTIHLTSATVLDNHEASTLTGGSGQDWFWSSALDQITNKTSNETVTTIS